MAIRPLVPRSKVYVVFVIAALLAALTLNIPGLQYEPLYLWIRIVVPTLFFIGMVGRLYGWRWLWFIGWLGIILYVLCTVGMIFPGEEYMSGGPDGPALMAPNLPSVHETIVRLLLSLVLVIVLVASYVQLDSPSQG